MEARIIRTSDYTGDTAYNKTFTTLDELLDFIETTGDEANGVIIFKQNDKWFIEIYDDYRE